MADTRTIYLHTNDTIFTSDPADTDYTYLDMSDYDSLNPEYSSTVRVQDGVIGVYDDYNVKITLTFTGQNSGRDERADWVNKYGHNIKQISVATTPTKEYVFNKSATVSSIEMIDTEYVNGAMVVVTLTLFGRWQSSLNWQQTHTEEYSGGTKKYDMSLEIPDYTDGALVDYAYTDSALTDNNNLIVKEGRNLYINKTQVEGYVDGNDGTIKPYVNSTKTMSSDYIAVSPNTQYIFQAWGSLLSSQQYWAGIGQYDANKVFLNRNVGIYDAPTVTSNVDNDYETVTFTTDANTYFVRVSSRTFGTYKIKFEEGDTPTDYSLAPEDTDSQNELKPPMLTTTTNKYSYNYKYGSTIVRNQVVLDPDKNRFIIVIEPNYKSGSITLANTEYSSTITSSNLASTSGISSDFITYTTGLFDNVNKFTMLDRGYVASTVWNNISDQYAKLYSITNTLNTDPANINVTNEAGQHVPFSLYVYSVQDFI